LERAGRRFALAGAGFCRERGGTFVFDLVTGSLLLIGTSFCNPSRVTPRIARSNAPRPVLLAASAGFC
jgi:hypothetical protein